MLNAPDRDRVALGHQMERLVATPEWSALVEWLQAAVNDHINALRQPCVSMDGALGSEYAKGTLNGIELTLFAPSRIIAEMTALIAGENADATSKTDAQSSQQTEDDLEDDSGSESDPDFSGAE